VAQRDEAARQLDHTIVKAPFAGIVTNVPALCARQVPAIVDDRLLSRRHGSRLGRLEPERDAVDECAGRAAVTVTVDTYPELEWHGTVESISPAAAQEFALLPAQNTSGNWVKVVQRIPLRVRLDTSDKSRPPLRAGMSVEVDIDTGHRRGLAPSPAPSPAQVLTTLFGRAHGSP